MSRNAPEPQNAGRENRKVAAEAGRQENPTSDSHLLDVPSRESFLANLLRSTDVSRNGIQGYQAASEPAPHVRGNTFKTKPPSELISRLQSFLPQLAAANEVLKRDAEEDPSRFDIENVGKDEEKVIEMNLGLGVFEIKKDVLEDEDDVVIDPSAKANLPALPVDAIVELDQPTSGTSDISDDSDDNDKTENEDEAEESPSSSDAESDELRCGKRRKCP